MGNLTLIKILRGGWLQALYCLEDKSLLATPSIFKRTIKARQDGARLWVIVIIGNRHRKQVVARLPAVFVSKERKAFLRGERPSLAVPPATYPAIKAVHVWRIYEPICIRHFDYIQGVY